MFFSFYKTLVCLYKFIILFLCITLWVNLSIHIHSLNSVFLTFSLIFFREGRGNAHLEGDYRKIGDVILKNFHQTTMDHYTRYIETHPVVLDKLEQTLHKNPKFEQVYRDFEMQKVCYLPLTTLLLKPLHRVLHYQLLLESKFVAKHVKYGNLIRKNDCLKTFHQIQCRLFSSQKRSKSKNFNRNLKFSWKTPSH